MAKAGLRWIGVKLVKHLNAHAQVNQTRSSILKFMSQMAAKLRRKAGVLVRGGWRPVWDRQTLQKKIPAGFDAESVRRGGFHGQNGQDKWVVEKIFKHRRNGFFVDIGANDGMDINNSYYLEQQLGWSGICVEPMPKVFAALARNRKCTCVHGCVAAQDGEVEFLEVEGSEMLSGLASTLNAAHQERITGHRINKLKLPGFSLTTLLRNHNVAEVDFMSIDTEGSEMEILRNFDWQGGARIKVICVENTYHGDLMPEFLYARGYRLQVILAGDEIYVRD
jgi:FkbM family methyltransferase